jgi:hypothetical protein
MRDVSGRRPSSTSASSSVGTGDSSSFSDSIFDRSRMSHRMPSRFEPALRITPRYSRSSRGSSVSIASSVMPRMAFSGVRISWLMLATNVDFARVADSAACSARLSSAVRSRTCCSRRSAFCARWWSRSWITASSSLNAVTSAPTSSSAAAAARSDQSSVRRTSCVVSTRLPTGCSRRVSSQWAAKPSTSIASSAVTPRPRT